MSLVARARSLWRNVTARSRVERELDEELESYVELLVAEKVRAGLAPAEARRRARLEVGGLEQVKEQVRDVRQGTAVESLLQDLRYGVRTLARTPAFTVAAVAALALGIGATVAIFSVVHAVLLRPLPYAEPERLVLLAHQVTRPVAPANFLDWRRESASFAAMGAAEIWSATLAGDGGPERLQALRTSDAVLPMTGVRPLLGRFPAPADGAGAREVALSWGLWQRRFAGDAAAVGRTVVLDGEPHVVVGVMPRSFDFPMYWARGVEIWAPLPLAGRSAQRDAQSLRVFARLRDGVTLAQARSEIALLAARLDAQHPGTNRDVTVTPLMELVVGDVRPALLVLLGAVALLLLIACANVAHLLLARAAERERELTVRVALGAGRTRLLRQLLTESLLLAAAGGAAGVLLAAAGTRWLVALAGDGIPRAESIGLSPAVLAFAVAVALATGVGFGLGPALRAARGDVATRLRDGARGLTAGAGRASVRGLLTVSQVALALLLLTGAGLMMRSFAALRALDPGFDARGVLSLVVSTTGSAHDAPPRRAALFEEALRRVRALPDVAAASAINHLPLAGDSWGVGVLPEGAPPPAGGERPSATYRVVLPGYFATMGIPLLRGRDVRESDVAGTEPVALVNAWYASRHWPGQDPIGKRVRLSEPGAEPQWVTIVGVVDDVVRREWAAPPDGEIYRPFRQARAYVEGEGAHVAYLTLVVRRSCGPADRACDPSALAAPVRAVLRELAPDVPVTDVRTIEGVVADAHARPRFNMVLLTLFASAAVVLAAVGIYGVMSYAVSRRTHEIGVRVALGARRGDVLRLVVGRGMALTLVGTAVGVAGALALSRLMGSLLFGVRPADPLTLAAVAALLSAVALGACAIPAWRALRIPPMHALRSD